MGRTADLTPEGSRRAAPAWARLSAMSPTLRHRRALAGLAAAVVSLPLLVATPASAQAATVGDATALIAAVGDEQAEIVLSGDITLTCDGTVDSALMVAHSLTLRSDGNGPHTLSVSNNGCRNRIIEVTGGHTLVVEDLILTGGRAPHGVDGTSESIDGAPGGHGGAILSDGAVTATRTIFSGNHAGRGGNGADGPAGAELGDAGGTGGAGGAGGNGGAIYATGSISATESSFSGNLAGNGGNGADGADGRTGVADSGGGVGGVGGAGGDGGVGGDAGRGGALFSTGEVEARRSTLDTNQAGTGGSGGVGGSGGQGGEGDGEAGTNGSGGPGGDGGNGGAGGRGGAAWGQSATISSSTVQANTVGAAGTGGGFGTGGPIGSGDVNSGSIGSNGDTGETGAAAAGGAAATSGSLDAISSTITDNQASSLHSGGDLGLNHTIVSGVGDDCVAGGSLSAGNSADGDGSCGDATTLTETEMALGPLASNGGPTRTQLPDAASELVNGGNSSCPNDRDQRGVRRAQQGACDIGAVEVRGSFEGVVTGEVDADTVTVGQTATVTFQLTVSAESTGVVDADEIIPVIDGCSESPARLGGSELSAGSSVSWICPVTSEVAGALAVNFSASAPDGEDGIANLNAVTQVTFTQANNGGDGTDGTTTTEPVVGGDGGDQADTGGGALPRTGLSVLLALAAGAALLFGGSGLSRFAKTRVGRSRWGLPYGEARPLGSREHTDGRA